MLFNINNIKYNAKNKTRNKAMEFRDLNLLSIIITIDSIDDALKNQSILKTKISEIENEFLKSGKYEIEDINSQCFFFESGIEDIFNRNYKRNDLKENKISPYQSRELIENKIKTLQIDLKETFNLNISFQVSIFPFAYKEN